MLQWQWPAQLRHLAQTRRRRLVPRFRGHPRPSTAVIRDKAVSLLNYFLASGYTTDQARGAGGRPHCVVDPLSHACKRIRRYPIGVLITRESYYVGSIIGVPYFRKLRFWVSLTVLLGGVLAGFNRVSGGHKGSTDPRGSSVDSIQLWWISGMPALPDTSKYHLLLHLVFRLCSMLRSILMSPCGRHGKCQLPSSLAAEASSNLGAALQSAGRTPTWTFN